MRNNAVRSNFVPLEGCRDCRYYLNLHAPEGIEFPIPILPLEEMQKWVMATNLRAGKPVIYFTIEPKLCPIHSGRAKTNRKNIPRIYVPKRTHELAGERRAKQESEFFELPKDAPEIPIEGEEEEFLVIRNEEVLGQTARIMGRIELEVRDQRLAGKLGLMTLARMPYLRWCTALLEYSNDLGKYQVCAKPVHMGLRAPKINLCPTHYEVYLKTKNAERQSRYRQRKSGVLWEAPKPKK
jgi:hypothetical protein